MLLRGGCQQHGALRAPSTTRSNAQLRLELAGAVFTKRTQTSTKRIFVKQLNDQCSSEKTMHKQ